MLADLVRAFCKLPDNTYEVCENYAYRTSRTVFENNAYHTSEITVPTIGIVLKEEHNSFSVLSELSSFLESQASDEQALRAVTEELDGASVEEFDGGKAIVVFPAIRNYQPLQP